MRTLASEIQRLIRGYDSNEHISADQRDRWYKNDGRASIRQTLLCNEGENCLRLLKNGGKPVVDISRAKSRKIFEYDNNHTFLTNEHLINICEFFSTDFFPSVHLLVKGSFEKHCAAEASFTQGGNQSLRDILLPSSNPQFESYILTFFPNIEELYALPSLKKRAQKQGYESLDSFQGVIEHLIASRCYLLGGDDKKFKEFIENENNRLAILKEGTPEDRGQFWTLKHDWLTLMRQLDTLSERVESQRLINAETHRQWLSLFGQLELELQALSFKVAYFERAILLKKASPTALEKEIIEQLEKEVNEHERKLSDIRRQVLLAPLLDKSLLEGTPVSANQLNEEKEACIIMLRKIKKLLHPDYLMHDPAYQKLGEKEKQQLHDMLIEALQIKNDELGVPKKFANHDFRTQTGLSRVLREIEKILRTNKIEAVAELEIKGDGLAEKIDWLSLEIETLNAMLLTEEARLEIFLQNEEVKRKQSIIENERCHNSIKNDYEKLIKKTQGNAEKLEQDYSLLFEK